MRCSELIDRLKEALNEAIEQAVLCNDDYSAILMPQRKENPLWEISVVYSASDDNLIVEIYHITNLERESLNMESYLKKQLLEYIQDRWEKVVDYDASRTIDIGFADWDDYVNYKYG